MHLLAERLVFRGWWSGFFESGSQTPSNGIIVASLLAKFFSVFTSIVHASDTQRERRSDLETVKSFLNFVMNSNDFPLLSQIIIHFKWPFSLLHESSLQFSNCRVYSTYATLFKRDATSWIPYCHVNLLTFEALTVDGSLERLEGSPCREALGVIITRRTINLSKRSVEESNRFFFLAVSNVAVSESALLITAADQAGEALSSRIDTYLDTSSQHVMVSRVSRKKEDGSRRSSFAADHEVFHLSSVPRESTTGLMSSAHRTQSRLPLVFHTHLHSSRRFNPSAHYCDISPPEVATVQLTTLEWLEGHGKN